MHVTIEEETLLKLTPKLMRIKGVGGEDREVFKALEFRKSSLPDGTEGLQRKICEIVKSHGLQVLFRYLKVDEKQ